MPQYLVNVEICEVTVRLLSKWMSQDGVAIFNWRRKLIPAWARITAFAIPVFLERMNS